MTGAGAVAARSRLSRWAKLTTVIAMILAFGLSSMALTALGIDYGGPGGNPLTKLHPANWLFAIALLCNVLSKPDPGAYLAALPREFPGAALFVAMWLAIIAHASLVQHAPVTPLIDTFFAAVAILPLYRDLDEATRARWRLSLHVIMLANASLGILEYLLDFRLTPFVVAGAPIVDDYRSTALLGHPLLNAGTTAAYILMLFFGGAPRDRPGWRAALAAPQMIAMVAFGGRTAIVLGAVVIALGALPRFAALLNGRRFDPRLGIVVAIATPIAVAAIFLAVSQGLLADLSARFVDDKGSSEARVAMFELFAQFPLEDLLLGPDQERLQGLQSTLGIEYGIEDSWLGFAFQYGLLISVPFVIGILALLTEYARRGRSGSSILIVFFLILASSSASISVKSTVLTQFAALMISIFGSEINHAIARRTPIPVGQDRELIY